jgi:hypothetical protein
MRGQFSHELIPPSLRSKTGPLVSSPTTVSATAGSRDLHLTSRSDDPELHRGGEIMRRAED